ncbi:MULTISPECIES: hypothetical protein [Nocardiopsis]|uniref:Uncharacterized protein n=1 Tax=Nocardiopsis sinuspersici TaxID=501010 RepID=A0A1V3BWQ8_9ACTN|nr:MULTISPECIES: hypothetical protein [Nocardiopsis]OOC52616.1 hypothetical protein NOSIN_01210 [Nocardiopsis sinuspersici]
MGAALATVLALTMYSTNRHEQRIASVMKQHEHHHVRPDDLATTERNLLLRTQQGVDAIVHSDLHGKEIIDDEILSAVVLSDVEWSIARQLRSQSERRKRIESSPAPGKRSQGVAAELLAAVEEEQRLTEGQVRTIAEYEAHVRAAGKELADLAAARELSHLKSELESANPWVEAAVSADAASLQSLTQVRDMAKRIAELAIFPEER